MSRASFAERRRAARALRLFNLACSIGAMAMIAALVAMNLGVRL